MIFLPKVRPRKGRSRKITLDMIRRVWRVHRRMQHVSLRMLARMAFNGYLGEIDVEYWEMRLVMRHQDCYVCALAKWRKLDIRPGSGIRPNIIGQCWSVDYSGTYATLAIGGYNGFFTFVELSCGYGIPFLVKSKMELESCTRKVYTFCRRYGHYMEKLRVDAGTVEQSEQFRMFCDTISDLGLKGIEILPAVANMLNQNPVERHHQHAKYLFAAVLVDQDLLPASFRGLAVISVWRTLNAVTNTLTPESTPMIELEKKATELEHQFRHPFGQPVICAKVGPKVNGMSVTKNEFGVIVGPGFLNNGTSFVYFTSRGCRSVLTWECAHRCL